MQEAADCLYVSVEASCCDELLAGNTANPAVCAPAFRFLQARQKLSSTCGSISQMYSFVDQATEATAAQLESTKLALQQHSAKQPATAEAPLEPGPGQVRPCSPGTALALAASATARVLGLAEDA